MTPTARSSSLALTSLALCLQACGFISYTAPLEGRTASSLSPMVSRKLELPLYIVIDPERIPSDFAVKNTRHSVAGFRPFLASSLHKAMSPFFKDVQVVAVEAERASGAHYVMEVKVDSVEARPLNSGQYTFNVLWMSWGIGLKIEGFDDYLFTFTGEGRSETSYPRLETGLEQMMSSGLNGLLEGWSKKEIQSKLIALEKGAKESVPAARQSEDKSI